MHVRTAHRPLLMGGMCAALSVLAELHIPYANTPAHTQTCTPTHVNTAGKMEGGQLMELELKWLHSHTYTRACRVVDVHTHLYTHSREAGGGPADGAGAEVAARTHIITYTHACRVVDVHTVTHIYTHSAVKLEGGQLMELEQKWPLVQAFGLEGVGRPGFFTQNFQVQP